MDFYIFYYYFKAIWLVPFDIGLQQQSNSYDPVITLLHSGRFSVTHEDGMLTINPSSPPSGTVGEEPIGGGNSTLQPQETTMTSFGERRESSSSSPVTTTKKENVTTENRFIN